MESQDASTLAVTLQRLSANGADSAQIAEIVAATWIVIDQALTPIVGSKGMAALSARSLYLVRGSYPWLAELHHGTETVMDFGQLRAVLSQRENTQAAAAGGAHLQTLYELLGSLIGPTLTRQLLGAAWSNPFDDAAAQDVWP